MGEEANRVIVKLEGRIVGPWSAELERVWRSLGPSLGKRKLCVDLCGVGYVDRQGRAILAEIYEQTHARFETSTPLMEYLAQQARSTLQVRNGNGNDLGKMNEKGAPK